MDTRATIIQEEVGPAIRSICVEGNWSTRSGASFSLFVSPSVASCLLQCKLRGSNKLPETGERRTVARYTLVHLV